MQKMRKMAAVQIRDQAFNQNDSVSVIKVIAKFERVSDSLLIQ